MYDAIMSTMSMTKRSGAVRLARRIGASPAVPAIAMRAPQTGDEARPMEVASSIGRSSVSVGTPSFAATAGVSGPKAKRCGACAPILIRERCPQQSCKHESAFFHSMCTWSRPRIVISSEVEKSFLHYVFPTYASCDSLPAIEIPRLRSMTIHAKRYQNCGEAATFPVEPKEPV